MSKARRYVSPEEAEIQSLREVFSFMHDEIQSCWQARESLERRVKALTEQRDELVEQIVQCRNAYRAQEIMLDLERQHSRLLGERFDALRSQLPSHGSKVERWVRGEAVAL